MTRLLCLIVLAVLFAPGCARVEGPPFVMNHEGRDLSKTSPSQKKAIVDAEQHPGVVPHNPLKGLGFQHLEQGHEMLEPARGESERVYLLDVDVEMIVGRPLRPLILLHRRHV